MVVNLFRSFLALTGFGLMSFTFTFWSHHQWELVLHRHEGYHPLRKNVHGSVVSYPSRASSTFTSRVNPHEHATTDQDQVPMIHIVYTRFMQHQPDLIELGLARIELLKEFFVQSLHGQTSHNFLVVIRTDPQLNNAIKQPLLTLFPNVTQSPYHFRYVVIGSNTNPKSHQYAHLIQQLEQPDQDDEIWSGTIQQAKDYLMTGSSAGSKIILETRLDSDDGLHAQYLEQLQHQARDTLSHAMPASSTTTNAALWRMWCANKYLEWQYMAPWDLKDKHTTNHSLKHDGISHKKNNKEGKYDNNTLDQETKSEDSSGLGALIVSRFGGCLSAGITLAYLAGPQHSLHESTPVELPTLQRHETLATTIPHCKVESNDHQQHGNPPSTNCLTMIQLNPAVVRARTPTSAGMMNIFWDWESSTGESDNKKVHVQGKNHHQEHPQEAQSSSESQVEVTRAYLAFQKIALQQQPYQEKLWLLVPNVFGMTSTRIRDIRDYLTIHMTGIAKDNLMGQCSSGHSCKDSSQVMLRKIVAET